MSTILPDSCVAALIRPEYDLLKWVEAHRTLDRRSSAETGLKRVSRTPYLVPLYQWFVQDTVKEIIIQKPAQIGITDWVVDCILWIAVNDPSPTALFLADQETARKIMRFRLDPAFRALGLVKKKQAKNSQQDISKFEIQLPNGFYLAVAWGSSISQTASMSFKRVFCDEVNKPGYAVIKDEGDTLDRIRERMETFGDSKFVLLSTPTTDAGKITTEFNAADVLYDYCVPCPACGVFSPMKFDGVKWEGGAAATREQIEASARYHCPACGVEMTDEDRQIAVSQGQAIAREPKNGEKIGYQLHRLNSLFKGGNLARMAYNFTRSQDDPQKLQNIINSTFGEPWIPRVSVSADDASKMILACRSATPKLAVPPDTICLVAGVDMQMQGFWYIIRAICADGSSALVDYGYLLDWPDLEEIIFHRPIGGKNVWRMLIDTGGSKTAEAYISRTEEAYLWIRANSGRGVQLFACKGSSKTMATKLSVGQPIEKTPSGKPLRGGIRIIQVNTQAIKDALWWKVERTNESPEMPGNWWVCADVEQQYISQFTAEEKRRDRSGLVEWVQVKKDNHLLDCEVYAYAAADPELFGGVRGLSRQIAIVKAQQARANPELKQNKQQRPNPYLEEY
jgi:terminase, large subunit